MEIIILLIAVLYALALFLKEKEEDKEKKGNFEVVHSFRWTYGDNNGWFTTAFLEDKEQHKRVYKGYSVLDSNKSIYDMWKSYSISTEQLVKLIK